MRAGGIIVRPGIAALLGAVLCAPSLLFVSPACPGEWHVTPIRLDLGREARSGVVSVVNDKPERLHLQMKAFEWTQDAEGKDRYEETNELLFFPRIIVFEKEEERIIRAGIRVPAAAKEKTFRLFIEEIPGPRKEEGASVSIAIRFGVPVFVSPLKAEAKGVVDNVVLGQGRFAASVRNVGNVHFLIRSVTVKGTDAAGKAVFSKEIAGWYLLAGAARVYTAEVPAEECRAARSVAVEVVTDRMTIGGRTDVGPSSCAP